jgi:2-C-methyl-D-erythritol 4-phosphate cytidylyltransferase
MPASKRNIAVIFAGGVGSRMNHPDGPKQFIQVDGNPIIIYTLEHFENHPDIDAIYIACLPERIEYMEKLAKEYNISKIAKVVEAGASAQESIYNGLQAAVEDKNNHEDTCVLIHDGVRPIINNKLIRDNIESVHKYGSAISAIRAYETVARSFDGDTVEKVEHRDHMYVLQAPQSFRLYDIYEAHNKSIREGMMGKFIDQAHMMNRYSHDLHMIEGFRGNVKITVPIDLTYFKFLVESGEFKNVTGESVD